MSFKKIFNVTYDDRGRRRWKLTSNEAPKPPEPPKEPQEEFNPIGYYCKECKYSCNDSNAWLEHLNSFTHNRGKQIKVEKATAESIEEKLSQLKKKKPTKKLLSIEEIMLKLDQKPSKKPKTE